jgi:hypothetical protein
MAHHEIATRRGVLKPYKSRKEFVGFLLFTPGDPCECLLAEPYHGKRQKRLRTNPVELEHEAYK